MITDDNEELYGLLKNIAVEHREVTLSSGDKSDIYIDCKQAFLHPQGPYAIEIALRPVLKLLWPLDGVAGVVLGGCPLVDAVTNGSLVWHSPNGLPGLYVRKEPKGHGTNRYLEGTKNLPEGSTIVLLEDVVTTASSALQAVQRLREASYRVEHVVALVDRSEGQAQANIEAAGLKLHSVFQLAELR